ncbi:MAG: alpha-amylase family glycosyl hydrolase [Desulfuromonadales bacterium]
MSQPLSHKLLVNRTLREQLKASGDVGLGPELTDFRAAQRLAAWCGQSGGELYLFALLNTAIRLTARQFLRAADCQPKRTGIAFAGRFFAVPDLGKLYRVFPEAYPDPDFSQAATKREALQTVRSREAVIAEAFLLETLTVNPAAGRFHALFDDAALHKRLDYHALLTRLDQLMINTPTSAGPPSADGLMALLQAPLRVAPDNLTDQVAYIIKHWAAWLPAGLIAALQVARATTIEEQQLRLPGPGPAPEADFAVLDGTDLPAAFTEDIDWMSHAVLLAKSIYVWLDQLSTRYQRPITTLAEIPEEELAGLARWGINTLWLIGLWERSAASKKIKQWRGNPEAEASAYALHAYRVAADLGGEPALAVLEERCRRFGIRLACDVVPNHTGLDSEWVLAHPDWFLQTDAPPYPSYRFTGPDLCDAEGISIRIEDGYWDHSDAAVVCEFHDHHTGRRRYIYHGNDGTHMPWNDTAQLNFLLPEVRQAMSDLIVAIAQRFSLIRFDAAMTLARKHFRRLWFPPPGGSAGVPSRSVFCLSESAFNQAFPVEFWRDVVDRINREAPDTLLIAEAFWMMENYFVRTLGMHRVYNSAFMNMLKQEENGRYRKILKETLAYNPEILKRYVNFMNNPDEATAIEQFGTGDKYFGVATLLVTLPGLPMFGHGQIEGLREKYGMEYRRAYWSETPDSGFIRHHEKVIFPILRRRQIFAGVAHFSLFDFNAPEGINDNVFAFSNGPPEEKYLVVYNNAPQATRGQIHQAAPQASAEREGQAQPMPVLAEELGLTAERGAFCRCRSVAGEEYLFAIAQLAKGLPLTLSGYACHVLYDFRMLTDEDGWWQRLHQQLQGAGVEDLDRERLRLAYQPLWQAFVALLDAERLQVLAGGLLAEPPPKPIRQLGKQLAGDILQLATALGEQAECPVTRVSSPGLTSGCKAIRDVMHHLDLTVMPEQLLAEAWQGDRQQPGLGPVLLGWLVLSSLTRSLESHPEIDGLALLREFGLDRAWRETILTDGQKRDHALTWLLMKTASQDPHPATSDETFAALCTDVAQRDWLGINQHAGQTWFVAERMAALAGALAWQKLLLARSAAARKRILPQVCDLLRHRLARASAVGYRLDKFLRLG